MVLAPLALRAAAEIELRRRRRATRHARPVTFDAYCRAVSPHLSWDWRHLTAYKDKLQQVADGACKRLIVNIPVRHGKSVTGSIHFPAYYLTRYPDRQVIIGGYGQTLAEKFSRRARSLARANGLTLNPERQAADDWETGASGSCRAVGVGGGITGHGGNLILVDDPVKNRQQAESPLERERVWDWWQNDLYTRIEPEGAVVVTMARWHKDDLTGRLLEQEGGDTWDVLHLPAIAEDDDPLGRAIGDALCPERYPADELLRIKAAIGEYAFQSLFQGSPIARTGGMFEPYGWPVLDVAPVCTHVIRYWDTAGTRQKNANHDPDWTVGALLGIWDQGRKIAVLDVARFREGLARRDAEIERVARADHAAFSGKVSQWIEQEAGVAGEDRTRAIITRLQGVSVYTERPTGDKTLRAEPFASQGQAGNVALVRGTWNETFRAELADFPAGKHDDQVDAAGAAFNKLATAASRTTHVFDWRI